MFDKVLISKHQRNTLEVLEGLYLQARIKANESYEAWSWCVVNVPEDKGDLKDYRERYERWHKRCKVLEAEWRRDFSAYNEAFIKYKTFRHCVLGGY